MDIYQSLRGTVEVLLTAADPATAVSELYAADIEVLMSQRQGEDITIMLKIRRQDLKKLRALAKRRGYEWKLSGKYGLYWLLKGLIRRPVLVGGFAFLLFLTLYIPSRIYFFQVEGNVAVPTNLILEKCGEYGLTFGCPREQVRSEKLKNALLEAIPELQWAGVNTAGCVATITVEERTVTEQSGSERGVASIVATQDGVITKCTVTKGTAACKVGQAVTAGQILISGYTDCGITIRGEKAEGEVYAQTQRSFTAVTGSEWTQKGPQTGQVTKYAVIIGKNRINFYKDSRISDSGCDRIYTETKVTLPGGFEIPVTLVTEVWTYYEEIPFTMPEEEAEQTLENFSSDYLKSQMIAGEILSRQTSLTAMEMCYSLSGKYFCHEMIGQTRNEESIPPYGKYD